MEGRAVLPGCACCRPALQGHTRAASQPEAEVGRGVSARAVWCATPAAHGAPPGRLPLAWLRAGRARPTSPRPEGRGGLGLQARDAGPRELSGSVQKRRGCEEAATGAVCAQQVETARHCGACWAHGNLGRNAPCGLIRFPTGGAAAWSCLEQGEECSQCPPWGSVGLSAERSGRGG